MWRTMVGKLVCLTNSNFHTCKSFPITSHEDSRRGWSFGLLSLLWYLAQLGWQSCQLYAPAVFSPQGNSLVLISITCWFDSRATESGQKGKVTWKFPRTQPGIEPILCIASNNYPSAVPFSHMLLSLILGAPNTNVGCTYVGQLLCLGRSVHCLGQHDRFKCLYWQDLG